MATIKNTSKGVDQTTNDNNGADDDIFDGKERLFYFYEERDGKYFSVKPDKNFDKPDS